MSIVRYIELSTIERYLNRKDKKKGLNRLIDECSLFDYTSVWEGLKVGRQ